MGSRGGSFLWAERLLEAGTLKIKQIIYRFVSLARHPDYFCPKSPKKPNAVQDFLPERITDDFSQRFISSLHTLSTLDSLLSIHLHFKHSTWASYQQMALFCELEPPDQPQTAAAHLEERAESCRTELHRVDRASSGAGDLVLC